MSKNATMDTPNLDTGETRPAHAGLAASPEYRT